MKPDDTISILVCVHSQDQLHDDLLHRALASLERQTYRNFDTHVVLDECHQTTIKIVDDFSSLNIQTHIRHTKHGLAAAKNFGLSKITSSLVGFLDADDQILPTKIEQQMQCLRIEPIDVLGTQAFDLYSDGTLTDNCFAIGEFNEHEQIVAELPNQNCLCHGSLMIRLDLLKTVGGYCEGKAYFGREDWATWIKLMHHGARFAVIPNRLYVYSMDTSVPR